MIALMSDCSRSGVRAAYDGKSAALLVESFKPHIGPFDIGLPDLSGYELASHVRATARTAEPRVCVPPDRVVGI